MISIVTPSFNQSQWLRLALASIADQQGVEHEHIVQDALSDDGTREWLSTEAGVRAYFEKDSGMYDAVNRGFAKARGDLCAHLNCDEQYLPGTLERVQRFFDSHPEVDVLFGDVLIIDQEAQAIAYRRVIMPTQSHIRASHLNVYTCAMFLRRKVIEAGHLLDSTWRSIGDAVWISGLLDAGMQVSVLPELLSVFTLTGQNLSTHDPVSVGEKAAWQAVMGKPSAAFRAGQIVLHRLRKLFAGAYRTRTFAYDIYTRESPTRRVRLNANSLGGIWPRRRS